MYILHIGLVQIFSLQHRQFSYSFRFLLISISEDSWYFKHAFDLPKSVTNWQTLNSKLLIICIVREIRNDSSPCNVCILFIVSQLTLRSIEFSFCTETDALIATYALACETEKLFLSHMRFLTPSIPVVVHVCLSVCLSSVCLSRSFFVSLLRSLPFSENWKSSILELFEEHVRANMVKKRHITGNQYQVKGLTSEQTNWSNEWATPSLSLCNAQWFICKHKIQAVSTTDSLAPLMDLQVQLTK